MFNAAGRAFGLGPRRERERLAEQVEGPVVALHDEADVDEALHGLDRGPELEARLLADRVDVGRAQDQRGEDRPPIVAGQQPDQLAGGEGRGRHAN